MEEVRVKARHADQRRGKGSLRCTSARHFGWQGRGRGWNGRRSTVRSDRGGACRTWNWLRGSSNGTTATVEEREVREDAISNGALPTVRHATCRLNRLSYFTSFLLTSEPSRCLLISKATLAPSPLAICQHAAQNFDLTKTRNASQKGQARLCDHLKRCVKYKDANKDEKNVLPESCGIARPPVTWQN